MIISVRAQDIVPLISSFYINRPIMYNRTMRERQKELKRRRKRRKENLKKRKRLGKA